MNAPPAHDAAATAARTSYGRLLSMLVAGTRDIAAAEDALADAFAAALHTWPERGVPDNPEAWLLTAARNKIKNVLRHARVRDGATVELRRRVEAADAADEAFPDERLKLLFVCAHPAIDESVRTPLILQTVLGLDAERVAAAFVVAPATMGQRLVRAKAKIRDAGLRLALPEGTQLEARLADVLGAIYAAYGSGWEELGAGDERGDGLAQEAIFLGRMLVSLMPNEPEPKGLLALMLYCESRRAARRTAEGRFVPLDQQRAILWNRTLIIEAEALLTTAAARGQFGRFQCEAAIQSVHVQRAITGVKNHAALVTLHRLLATHAPSLGVQVSLAAVLLDAGDVAAARDALAALPVERVRAYQPYWVTIARLHELHGERTEARAALVRALDLTRAPAVRTFLEERLRALDDAPPEEPPRS